MVCVNEDKKASNIVKALQYARQNWQPWIGVMTLWTLPDPAWTTDREEYWWAITNADGTPRQAYSPLAGAPRRCAGWYFASGVNWSQPDGTRICAMQGRARSCQAGMPPSDWISVHTAGSL